LLALGFAFAVCKELKVLNGYAMFASLASILGGPTVKCQSAFNEDWVAFMEILIDCLGCTTERPKVYETDFLLIVTIIPFPFTISGYAEVGYRCL